MTVDRELLSQHLDDVHAIKESIKTEFVQVGNPGLPAVFRELQLAVRALEDAENLLDGLTVKG